MGRNIDDIIDSLPKSRREKINARAQTLASEMIAGADSLAALRQLSGVTQKQLGELLGVNQNSVSQMEKRTDVYLSTLRNVAVALGWELEVALRAPDGERVALPNFQPWNTEEAPSKRVPSKAARGVAPRSRNNRFAEGAPAAAAGAVTARTRADRAVEGTAAGKGPRRAASAPPRRA